MDKEKKWIIALGILSGIGIAYAYLLTKKVLPAFPQDYVSWWKLRADFTDVNGLNNGTPIGNTVIVNDPERGSAASFDGVSHIDCGNNPSLDFTNGLTISMWVKTISDIPWSTFLNKGGANGGAYWLGTYFNSRQLRGDLHIEKWDDLVASEPMEIGTWYHVAMTFDGTTQILYQNGEEIARQERTGLIDITIDPLEIGADSYYPHYFNGLINDVLIYGRTLSSNEIWQIYNAQK